MIFVDTSFFAALLLPKDINHRRAAQAVEDLGQVHLSDILFTTYSAVDCLSFVVMLKQGINEALSFDSDFARRFVVRPGPRPK